jgi:hypothetical protein
MKPKQVSHKGTQPKAWRVSITLAASRVRLVIESPCAFGFCIVNVMLDAVF